MLLHLCKGLTWGIKARMYYEIRVPTPVLSGSGPLGMISARITPDTPANCYFGAKVQINQVLSNGLVIFCLRPVMSGPSFVMADQAGNPTGNLTLETKFRPDSRSRGRNEKTSIDITVPQDFHR